MTESAYSKSRLLLIDWLKRIRISQSTHYQSSRLFSWCNYFLGVPAVILSTIVGTSVFVSLEKTIDDEYKIIVGLISIMAAALAGLQTFLRFEEKAEKHRTIAVRCASLRREVEQILSQSIQKSVILDDNMTNIREKYDKITEDAPSTSSRIYLRALKTIELQDKFESNNANTAEARDRAAD